MTTTRPTPFEKSSAVDQIGLQLCEWLTPTGNQVAMLKSVGDRHRVALLKAVEYHLDRREALQSLILSPLDRFGEGSGEVRTALSITNNSHQAVVAATIGVSTETRSILTSRQSRRLADFVPTPAGSTEARDAAGLLCAQLENVESVLESGRFPSDNDLGDIVTGVNETIDAFHFPDPLASTIRRLVTGNVWFWSVLPAFRPAGLLLPRRLADLALSFAGSELRRDVLSAWCEPLAQVFDSTVLPAGEDSSRLRRAALGLVLLTRGFVNGCPDSRLPESCPVRPVSRTTPQDQ